jgi:glycosyltransferase involved in cell wall biosynthesis
MNSVTVRTETAGKPGRNILCLITDAYGGHGGIALYSRDVLATLCSDPQTDTVVAIPRVEFAPLEALPDKLINDRSGLGGAAQYVAAIWRHLRSGRRFDAVYCAHVNLIPLAHLAAKYLNVPWVLCLYGVEAWTPTERYLSRKWAIKADRVISISQFTLDRFRSWCPVPLSKCSLVPNAVRIDEYALTDKDPALLDAYGLRDRKVVMTLGRLNPMEQAKGFDRVIEMLPELRRHHPDLMYLIVGKGDDQPRLEGIAKARGVSDAVVFAGFVSEADKPAHYALADAFVMPSVGEGFGYVYVEAMACGIPVVGSSVDGSVEALRNGMLGELVDPFDQPALIAATLNALAQPRAIPEGIDYFTFEAFRERFTAAMAPVLAKA